MDTGSGYGYGYGYDDGNGYGNGYDDGYDYGYRGVRTEPVPGDFRQLVTNTVAFSHLWR